VRSFSSGVGSGALGSFLVEALPAEETEGPVLPLSLPKKDAIVVYRDCESRGSASQGVDLMGEAAEGEGSVYEATGDGGDRVPRLLRSGQSSGDIEGSMEMYGNRA